MIEAATHLVQQGLLDVPDVKCVNAKRAPAVLWNAAWLQEYLSALWREQGHLPPRVGDVQDGAFKHFALAIVGPAGTGKTAVLKVTGALFVFFVGPDCVRKLAPSNAAARLLGGGGHSSCIVQVALREGWTYLQAGKTCQAISSCTPAKMGQCDRGLSR